MLQKSIRYITVVYAKMLNNNHDSSIEKLQKFLGSDIGKIGKISEDTKHGFLNDITLTEMKQELIKLGKRILLD